MKAFLHIHNTWEFCHKEVKAEIEIDNRPMVGDYFWMGEETMDKLEKQIAKFVNGQDVDSIKDAYGELRKPSVWCPNGISLADHIHIVNILWKSHEDGKYYMHIELHDSEDTED